MAVGKEIRTKIKSVESTRKITKAMEMIAASKMRKAQDRMRSARPYSDKIRNITANLSTANPEYHSPYMRTTGNSKAVGFIVVTTDKGLCGGLNTNVLRAVTNKLRDVQAAGGTAQAVAIGNKGFGFLNRVGAQVVSHVTQIGDKPQLEKLIGPVKVMLDAFVEGRLDAVYLCYTRFINTMKQEPVVEPLLPLGADRLTQSAEEKSAYGWDYIYEPDAADRDRGTAHALRRGAHLPGGGREHGLGAVRAHGRDEGGVRQRRQPDRRAQAGLQQDAAGGDHEGIERNRQRRCCRLTDLDRRKQKWHKARSFSASARWSTWSSRATTCRACTTRSRWKAPR